MAIQIFSVLLLIVIIILFVLRDRKKEASALPDHYRDLLNDYVKFYMNLDEDGKKKFEDRLQKFLSVVKITGTQAEIEDLDRVLIGSAAIIPVYFISDWEYINLREVLVYPGNFNTEFEQHGADRMISGMVGTGAMKNVLIISKWELRQGFINGNNNRNTAIHEFVHLIDQIDGTFDGVPEILLERRYVAQWKELMQVTMEQISRGESDIDYYATTNPIECFAVLSEYFFEQPELFATNHPQLNEMLQRIYVKKPPNH